MYLNTKYLVKEYGKLVSHPLQISHRILQAQLEQIPEYRQRLGPRGEALRPSGANEEEQQA
jgi:hypothetical protein